MITLDMKWDGESVKIQGKKVVGKTSYETALKIEGDAKLLCARRYGYLAASINTQTKEGGTNVENSGKYAKEKAPAGYEGESIKKIEKPVDDGVAHVGTAVSYASHVEFGTVKMDAQPFLRPAFDLAQGKVLEIGVVNGKSYFKDYLK
jgi:HK97 gp10 family phage protein